MRNILLFLTVLSVSVWTGYSGLTDLPGAQLDTRRQGDFYIEDDEDIGIEGSGELGSGSSSIEESESYSSEYGDSYSSSFSSVPGKISTAEPGSVTKHIVRGTLSLKDNYIEEYDNKESPEYMDLERRFKQRMTTVLQESVLNTIYVECIVYGFSAGSIVVDFGVVIRDMPDHTKHDFGSNIEETSVGAVLKEKLNAGNFAELKANASSLVIHGSSLHTTEAPDVKQDTTIVAAVDTTKLQTKEMKETKKTDPMKRPMPDEPEKEPKDDDIFAMILGDPILIAAIAGGLVVIILSVVLLFLFVVYRLKKKDEGSYSLDEPNKAKDPTAYWKETKEFYA